jgi:hypothetical protein
MNPTTDVIKLPRLTNLVLGRPNVFELSIYASTDQPGLYLIYNTILEFFTSYHWCLTAAEYSSVSFGVLNNTTREASQHKQSYSNINKFISI